MSEANWKRLLGLILLSVAIFYFRREHQSALDFVLATATVIAFWALHALKISRFNLRTLVLLLFLFGVPFILARQLPIFSTPEATTGPWTDNSFDPAKIGSIAISHRVAMQTYMDHIPTPDERYFKTNSLEQSADGLHYQDARVNLNLEKMPRTAAWVDQNLKGQSEAEKTRLVEIWFRQNLHYSLHPGQLLEAQPLDEFLFDRRLGYCQHFSAALATLLKLSGSRARVAVGFQGGTWNPLHQELTFEMADSHAWVEVYDRNKRIWGRLDPTLWVASADEQKSESLPSSALIGILVGAVLIFAFIRSLPSDPREILSQRLARLEQRRGLESFGLTYEERLTRLMNLHPKLAPPLTVTLQLYHAAFFGRIRRPRRSATFADRRALGARGCILSFFFCRANKTRSPNQVVSVQAQSVDSVFPEYVLNSAHLPGDSGFFSQNAFANLRPQTDGLTSPRV